MVFHLPSPKGPASPPLGCLLFRDEIRKLFLYFLKLWIDDNLAVWISRVGCVVIAVIVLRLVETIEGFNLRDDRGAGVV